MVKIDSEPACGRTQENIWSKYSRYDCQINPEQNDKATVIKWCSISRPHMRAFYCCFWGFFIGCFVWFAINPLLPEIRTSLDLETSEIWTSSILCVSGTLIMRLALGPLCDKFGPRVMFPVILCCASVATGCIGLINTAAGLYICRTFVGFAGAVFVLCQGWISAMFADQIEGTAISVVAGWGNLASGLTQLVVGSALFPLFKTMLEGDSEMAWRIVPIVPAVIATLGGILILFISDDTPRGDFKELRAHGSVAETQSAARSFQRGVRKLNTWFLCMQNACATGAELTIHSASALYFQDRFAQSTEAAAAISSILGWMGLCCGIGGYLSDKANKIPRGRLYIQASVLLCEGSLLLIFPHIKNLASAIAVMTFLSFFIQVAEGTTYSLVPFVDPTSTGSVSGIVSASGNLGAILFGISFRQLSHEHAFAVMGTSAVISALASALMFKDAAPTGNHMLESVGSTISTHDQSHVIEVKTHCDIHDNFNGIQRVEISSTALKENVDFFRRLCRDSLFMVVVKSNAYGHGIEQVVSILEGYVDWFGVNSLEEAARVRSLDSKTPILVMGTNTWGLEQHAIASIPGLTFAVSSIRAIESLEVTAPSVPFHLVVDTGLSRLGYLQGSEMDGLLQYIVKHPKLPFTGIMTHFANVDDTAYTLTQLNSFQSFRKQVEDLVKRPLMAHAAASSAALVLPESRLDMVRIGIGTYGLWPSPHIKHAVDCGEVGQGLKPVMQWVSRIVHCHWIPPGTSIGYECTVKVSQPTRVGVIPVGYHDGYDRALSNCSSVLIRGYRCRVIGMVSMNMMTVDITRIPGDCEGDRVVLIGKSEEEVIGVEHLATLIGTIPYEFVARVDRLIPRVIVD